MAFKFDSFRSKDYLEHLEVCQDILEDMLDQKSDKTPNWKGQSQVDNIKSKNIRADRILAIFTVKRSIVGFLMNYNAMNYLL